MDIQQIIKERYKELPANIQEAITNTNLASKFETIAKKHSLHIDQNGALQTETILVMLGLESSDDYVDNIKNAMEISRDQATEIAKDVNTEILDSIRDSLRKIQEQNEQGTIASENTIVKPQPIPAPTPAPTPTPTEVKQMISSVEKAGNFTIENTHPQSSSPQYKEEGISREELLKKIEDEPVPLVDHLLTTPVINPQVVETKQTEIPQTEVKKEYSADPYREQV